MDRVDRLKKKLARLVEDEERDSDAVLELSREIDRLVALNLREQG